MPTSIDWTRAFKTKRNEIEYLELPNYSEGFRDDGTQSVRRLACRFKDRIKFVLDMLGFSYIQGTGTSKKLRRYLPEKHPNFDTIGTTGLSALWAQEMEYVGGLGWPGQDDDGAISYNDAQWTNVDGVTGVVSREENGEGLCVYDVLHRPSIAPMLDDDAADADPDKELSRFVTITREPAAENFEFGRGILRYTSPDGPCPTQPPTLFPTAILNVNFLQVPADAMPVKTIFGYWDTAALSGDGDFITGAVGAVNSVPFLGYEAETLLMLPPRVRLYQGRTTDIYEDWTFPLQYRGSTHQRVLRPIGGPPPNDARWNRVKRVYDGSSTAPLSIFPTFDFAQCFDVSNP